MCHFPRNRPPPSSPPLLGLRYPSYREFWGTSHPASQRQYRETAYRAPKTGTPSKCRLGDEGVLFIPSPSFSFLLTRSQRPRGTCVMSSSQQGKWSVVPVSVWGEGEGCCLALAASSFPRRSSSESTLPPLLSPGWPDPAE